MNLWLVLLIAACAADVATTAANLKSGGQEVNLLPAALIKKIGVWPTLLGTKAILIGIGAWVDVKEFYICLAVLNLAAAAYSFAHRAKPTKPSQPNP